MKLMKKIGIFLIVAILLCSICTVSIFAAESKVTIIGENTTETDGNSKLDMNLGDRKSVV